MTPQFTEFDRAAMQRALQLARRGLETTHPNPRVGCVIARDSTIVGEGAHEWAGEPHAEIHALKAAGDKAVGATVYVTLEPCSHFGRTPPCVDALIAARVGKVVYAMQDPNPQVSGRGAERLRQAGIFVSGGLLEAEAKELNAGYVMRRTKGRPLVRLKLAMSLDGRTALANGASKWITSEASREDVQHWRARSSAVLTGIGTVLADNPRLDVRLPAERRRHPARIVLDGRLRTPTDAKLFDSSGDVLIFCASSDNARREALIERGARVEQIGSGGKVDLHALMRRLGELEMNEVLVESGATLAGALLRANLVDELLIYMAPMLLGHEARPLIEWSGLEDLGASPRFEIVENTRVGPDLRLRLRP